MKKADGKKAMYETSRWNRLKESVNENLTGLMVCMAVIMVVFGGQRIQPVNAAVTLTSSAIKNAAESKVGQSFQNNLCLRFVEQVYQGLGVNRPHLCCAYRSGSKYIVSSSSSNIPVGATVYFGNCAKGPCRSCGSRYYGHVGIYVGDGYFVHATGGRVQKTRLSSWANKYRGYGYSGNFTIRNDGSNSQSLGSNSNDNGREKPVINDVKITDISSDHIKFNFSTNEVTDFVRIVFINAANNQQDKEDLYDAQSKIYTVDKGFDISAGNQFYIRIYAYTKKNGNYINETLHAMTYGSVIGMVQLPKASIDFIQYSEHVPSSTLIMNDAAIGWIAVKGTEIDRISAMLNGKEMELDKLYRQDVEKVYPDYNCCGYSLDVSMADLVNGSNSFSIQVHLSNGETRDISSGTILADKVNIFDAKYFYNKYASVNSQVRAIGISNEKELERYWYSKGIAMGMDPSAAFSFSVYKKCNADVVKVFGSSNEGLFSHLICFTLSGNGEFRRVSDHLELSVYRESNRDLGKMTTRQLMEHYAKYGYYEKRKAI